jgi:hypothetical protein
VLVHVVVVWFSLRSSRISFLLKLASLLSKWWSLLVVREKGLEGGERGSEEDKEEGEGG